MQVFFQLRYIQKTVSLNQGKISLIYGQRKNFFELKKVLLIQKNLLQCKQIYFFSLNLNQWTATDSQRLFTDGSSYKSFTENQWNRLNAVIESVKSSGGNNKIL